jgi:tRNA_anti-like
MKPIVKWIFIGGVILALIASVAAWFIFNDKFDDTTIAKSNFSVDATSFIKEFEANDSLANKKYVEQIIEVKGNVAEIEEMDSLVNVKMIDTTKESYIIFAFQQEQMPAAKNLKEGDLVTIKGSCSGGAYSSILEVEGINFKRCVIIK